MLKRLRLQLTLLYLFLGFLLFAAAGVGAYSVLYFYFQHTTDLALQYKAGQEFNRYNSELPDELERARLTWGGTGRSASASASDEEQGDDGSDSHEEESARHDESNEQYDADLAPIFVYALIDGHLLTDAQSAAYPIALDPAAVDAALAHGSDWRTIRSRDNSRVRLLTYRIPAPEKPVVIQLGRRLNDQDRILSQFILGMALLGAGTMFLLGGASWLLAGRSLNPAQRAWEQQQTFVANASHELRTPLTLMRAAAEIALRSNSAAEQKNLLQDVIADVDHMSRLVEDLLLLSRLDAGRLKLVQTPIALPEFLSDLGRQVSRVAGEKNIRLALEEVQGTALGDADRLRQVLLILLDNALRHTPAGGTISIRSAAKGSFVLIVVQDDGPGISAEHLARIFDRFYQIPGLDRDDPKGNGLGLSIAKSLAHAMGGTIHVESRPGNGTQVTITIPAVQAGGAK